MKGKYLFGGFLMALAGAAIALFVYTTYIEKPVPVVAMDSSKAQQIDANALLTSFQSQEGQVDFTYAAEQTVHAVVHVRTKSMVSQPQNPILEWFYGDRSNNRPREQLGFGSGCIISPDGYIITNNHVVEDAENIEVVLNDNRVFPAKIVGRDPSSDIALLKIDANNLSFLKYGDSDKLRVGEWVLAVGNPFNLTSTVTAGIVSAKGRNLPLNDDDYSIESYIQTDAALNVGNSGGALVDSKGLLVGITNAIYSPSGAYAGNSFAIPVNLVKKVVDDLRQYGEVQRAIIGVVMTDVTPDVASKQKLEAVKGAVITQVRSGSAAEEANLKANDVIVKFDGVSVGSSSELQEQVGRHRPGDRATITYIRNGTENTVPIVLKNVAGNTSVVKPGMGLGEIFGARVETVTSTDKQTYDIDHGIKITELNDGLFSDMGLKKGTIILSINDKRVNSADDVRQITGNSERSIKSIRGVFPDGREFDFRYGN